MWEEAQYHGQPRCPPGASQPGGGWQFCLRGLCLALLRGEVVQVEEQALSSEDLLKGEF